MKTINLKTIETKTRFMGNQKVWDYLAWIVLAGILLWLILKVAGVIHTPEIISYSPIFGAVYLAGWAMHRLKAATDDIKEIKDDMGNLENRTNRIESDIRVIKSKYSVANL